MLSDMSRMEDKVGIMMVQFNREVFRVSEKDKLNHIFEIHSITGGDLSTDIEILEMVSGKEGSSGTIVRTEDNKFATVKID